MREFVVTLTKHFVACEECNFQWDLRNMELMSDIGTIVHQHIRKEHTDGGDHAVVRLEWLNKEDPF